MAPRRKPKRRTLDPATELRAWSTYFETGHDFFSELGWLDIADAAEARRLVPEAWQRLGSVHMATRNPSSFMRDGGPWALEKFGPPPARH